MREVNSQMLAQNGRINLKPQLMVSAMMLLAFNSGRAMAQEFEISYSGTMNGDSINEPLAGSFFGGQAFSGTVFFDASATTTTSYGGTYTVGNQMSLDVGQINAVTSPFTIYRQVDEPQSQENYYYFDGYGATGSLTASGYTMTRDILLYQVPYSANPSLYTSLITTQAQIDAGFPNWTLAMFLSNGTDSQQIFGTVTSMKIEPVPLPASLCLMLGGLVGLGAVARPRRKP